MPIGYYKYILATFGIFLFLSVQVTLSNDIPRYVLLWILDKLVLLSYLEAFVNKVKAYVDIGIWTPGFGEWPGHVIFQILELPWELSISLVHGQFLLLGLIYLDYQAVNSIIPDISRCWYWSWVKWRQLLEGSREGPTHAILTSLFLFPSTPPRAFGSTISFVIWQSQQTTLGITLLPQRRSSSEIFGCGVGTRNKAGNAINSNGKHKKRRRSFSKPQHAFTLLKRI